MNIFIGNLSFHTSEEELQDLFKQFGEVNSVRIITDKFSGRSKGFAFVEMPDQAQAEEAINQLNDYMLNQRAIRVNEAQPREDNNNRFNSKRY
ncbi:MAG TPA: RNA-binding protein [Flavobacterium sp.]|nr:RNA-binding protein [Flavobacterium sp.]